MTHTYPPIRTTVIAKKNFIGGRVFERQSPSLSFIPSTLRLIPQNVNEVSRCSQDSAAVLGKALKWNQRLRKVVSNPTLNLRLRFTGRNHRW